MSVLSALDPTSLLLGGVVLLCLLWWLSTRRPPGIPPGPGPALPLLGHLHLVDKDPQAQFWKWRRQYGDMFSLYMGGQLVVVLASYSAIREALVTFADIFSHRPHSNFILDYPMRGTGIAGTSGPTWKEQRKTALEILREMGVGKNVLAEKIQEEITHYIRAIKDHQGSPVDLRRLTQMSISNNICSIVFGKRFNYHDSKFITYLENIELLFKMTAGTAVLNYLPNLRYLPGDPFNVKKVEAIVDFLFDFIGKQTGDHQKTMEEDKEGTMENTDFIYSYLHQIQKRKTRGDVNTSLDDRNLRRSVFDLFLAGTEATYTGVQWAMLFFLHHPHVQESVLRKSLTSLELIASQTCKINQI